ncbi:MAG: ABC transporter ATP-binding protein/permease [Clostridiales bacterium]|nr:ABC transporter ATP-binding protein/permease [Clostridiales bacterium]
MRAERKQVIRDCGKAMNLTVFIYGLTELVTGVLTTYIATVLGRFADAVLTQNLSVGRGELMRLLACILLLSIVIPLLSTLPEIQMFSATLRHERMLFQHFLDRKYSAFRSMDEGDLAYLISEEATEMRIYWTLLGQHLLALPFLTAYLLYSALQVSVLFTLVVFAISLLKLLIPIAVKKWRVKYDQETRAYNQSRRNLEVALIGQAWKIRIYGIQKGILSKLSSLYEEYYEKVLKKSAVLEAAANGLGKWLDTFCVLMILVCGVILAANGNITVGAIAAMYGYFTVFDLLLTYAQYIAQNVPILNNIFDKVEMLYRELEEELPASEEKQADFQRLDCTDLGFFYGARKVFAGVSLSLEKGEKLLLEGENGSGKTTLFRILCGLEDDYSGKMVLTISEEKRKSSEILRVGEDGKSVSVQLRCRAAVVERDDYLFEGTVRENVQIGNLDASKGQVDAVLKELGILHLSERLVGADHKNLSGGEQKRVAIARALLKDADLFFLDEPENGLDADTRAWLIHWLNETDQTVVLISHDPEFVAEILAVRRMPL